MKFTIEFEEKQEALETLAAVDTMRAFQAASWEFNEWLRREAQQNYSQEVLDILHSVIVNYENTYGPLLED